MTIVDRETEPRLERIVSELRTQAKLDAAVDRFQAVLGDHLAESSAAGREGGCQWMRAIVPRRPASWEASACAASARARCTSSSSSASSTSTARRASRRSCAPPRPATPTSIVVDLGELEFIDSTGLRLLVMAAERSAPGRFSLLRGPKQVHRVFEITDLVDRLPFAD